MLRGEGTIAMRTSRHDAVAVRETLRPTADEIMRGGDAKAGASCVASPSGVTMRIGRIALDGMATHA